MKVIFLKDVPRVGKRHEVKEVNDGYALNFLLPHKMVELATPKALKELEIRKKEIVVERQVQEDLLLRNMEELKGKTITIRAKANEKGSLFSAIHKKEILEVMRKEHKATLSEESMVLEKPIKETGEFNIPVVIKDKKSSFTLIIEAL
ncbi:MAG: 50S ribosomal protein L9 [Candidatus Paceibacteria bacterium]